MRKRCRRSGGTARRSTVQAGTIKANNDSGFADKVVDRWAYENGVELDFSRRGTPTDNAMVESFDGRLRQECLNEHWFLSLADARSKIEAWRRFYNEERPPTVHWHGKALRNSPENTGPKRIPWCQKKAKSLPADGPATGMITIGGGSSQHSQKIRNGQKRVGKRPPPTQ